MVEAKAKIIRKSAVPHMYKPSDSDRIRHCEITPGPFLAELVGRRC